MICKIYSKYPSKVEVKELFEDLSDPLVMPSVQLEDKNGKEIFLYDVLLDNEGEGWVVYFHEKGYICLSRIGSKIEEKPLPVMDFLNKFGNHYYSLPMEVVGNKYVDGIEDSFVTPNRCRNKFKEYLRKNNYIINSSEDILKKEYPDKTYKDICMTEMMKTYCAPINDEIVNKINKMPMGKKERNE